MSVWYAIPSARPDAGTVHLWKERGYRVALIRDEGMFLDSGAADIQNSMLPYPGYAISVNFLVRQILEEDPTAEWIVTGGDDVEPDMNHAPEEIAAQLAAHFRGTFGVCQPTGDRFAGGSIDRIAGSPWMGAEFCRRMYGGCGPFYGGYQHMFSDEELLCVAEKLGAYLRRPDLIHLHNHFMRESRDVNSRAVIKEPPSHLVQWNSPQHWQESQTLFMRRKATGFPGHEPISIEVAA